MVISDNWGTGGKKDPFSTSFSGHIDDFLRSCTTDDGVIDQEDGFAVELRSHGVELPSHGGLSLFLVRHDKGSADVSVFDEPFSVRKVEGDGALEGGVSGGVWDRDDDVNLF